MSGNTTTNQVHSGVISLAIIQTSIQGLLISHTFLILMIPLMVALFYYSTPSSRRQPIFILNILALALCFVTMVICDALNIHSMLFPQDRWPAQIQISVGFIGNFQVMFVDAILLVRLITVHPLSRIGPVRFTLLMFLPVALKIGRVINLSIYMYELGRLARGPNGWGNVATAWLTLPFVKIEWIAQVVDSSYASIAFLWTIRSMQKRTVPHGLTSRVTFRQSSIARRIRILFRLSLSNFVIPSLISIVQLVALFRIGTSNPYVVNDIAAVNTRISVIGVVFATVWAGKEHRRQADAVLDSIPVGQHCDLEPNRVNLVSHVSVSLATESCQEELTSEKDATKDDHFVGGHGLLPRQSTHSKSTANQFRDMQSSGLSV